MTTLLTILVPTWNRKAKLERLLTVLIPVVRALPELDLIVSTNGSTDDTSAYLERFQNEPRVKLHYQPANLGPNIHLAWLYGQARGRFLWMIGDDDLPDADLVEDLIKILKANPEVGLIHLPGVHHLRDGLPPLLTPCPPADEHVAQAKMIFAPYVSYLGWISSNVIQTRPLQEKLPAINFLTVWWPQDLLAASIADHPGLVLSVRKINGGADSSWKDEAHAILVSQFVISILDSRWLSVAEKKSCLAQRYRDYPNLYRFLLLQNPRLFWRVTRFMPSLIFRTQLISKGIKKVVGRGFPRRGQSNE